MSRMMIQAAVTMGQLQNKLDMIGHNLANTNTPGYKTRHADFSSLLFQQMDNVDEQNPDAPRNTPEGIRVGAGAKLGQISIDLTRGNIQVTDRALDAALLTDNQLFQVEVQTPGGTETQFTRSGNFYLSQIGNGQTMLTDANGHALLGENGPIIIEGAFNGISIEEDGMIIVDRPQGETAEGRIEIVEAVRPRLLEAAGGNKFRLPDMDELGFAADEIIQIANRGNVQIKSGALESSNVDISKQMTDMLMAQRAYQFNGRSISLNDQMSGLVNQLRS
ncbi:flagellar hook-basal body protein [Thalassobacillus pellis]|uniref:flagellar hook-basal body protein n=1 Tax=Thalassobacillus pellis TaxID=748008 RepID=UPI0019610534|nr:flagellar hook-basal body protein [Thalassobacillus pellis]MBM7551737.1 flagellar basal-body rod protein FlgG [Thalassobacillus pellis]